MNKAKTASEDKTRRRKGQRGLGRLYKRDSEGKEQKANSKVRGYFYLEYKINGRRVRQAIKDEHGEPVSDLRAAERIRKDMVAPLQADNDGKRWKAIQSRIAISQDAKVAAEEKLTPPLKMSEAWVEYVASPKRPDSGDRTLRDYESYFAKFTSWLSDKHKDIENFRDVSIEVADGYAKHLVACGVSPNTYNKHITFMKLIYKVLGKRERMLENPWLEIQRKKKLKTQSRKELTIEHLKKLIEEGKGEMGLLFCLGATTGLRLGDCATLRWSEVDLIEGIIKRVPNKTADNKQPVIVGISSTLREKLDQIPPKLHKGYVLPECADAYNSDNKRPQLSRAIQKHFEDCGIQTLKEGTGFKTVTGKDGKKKQEYTGKRAVVEFGFHSLRHTFVSIHARNGTPQSRIQRIVGHSNPSMTEHYTHISEADAKASALALPSGDEMAISAKTEINIKELVATLESMDEKNWKEIRKQILAMVTT